MNNKRFSSAKISTNFIEEEFGDKYTPDSADNPNLSNLIAVAATANRLLSEKYQKSFIRSENNEIQAIQSPNIPEDWVVLCKGDSYPIKLKIKNDVRLISLEYLLNTLITIMPKLAFIFKFFSRFNFLKKITVKINLFDLKIYFAKSAKSK